MNTVTILKIQEAVAQYWGIRVQDLKSSSRVRPFALPRQMAVYLIRSHTQLGFKEIGEYFGGRDHTTILHAYHKILESVRKGDVICETVREIENILKTDTGRKSD